MNAKKHIQEDSAKTYALLNAAEELQPHNSFVRKKKI